MDECEGVGEASPGLRVLCQLGQLCDADKTTFLRVSLPFGLSFLGSNAAPWESGSLFWNVTWSACPVWLGMWVRVGLLPGNMGI